MACASCWKRRNRSGSRAKAAGKTLIATSRLSRASRARYTSPMPPAPTADTISYGPSFVPGVRAIRARNYRLVQHVALDATILDGWSANRKLSRKRESRDLQLVVARRGFRGPGSAWFYDNGSKCGD